jgi:hypothetical protein
LNKLKEMNLAIIIGVSNYIESNNLPGCKNDADAMWHILQKTEKFPSILYINNDESSAITKEQIANYITEHQNKPIEEFFFYYTGHGEFFNDDFFYILSDYIPKKRNQTSLQNTEIDEFIKTISPNLVIKVIDACQSGTTYIKDSASLTKYFQETKQGFKNCYFLSSSLNNQYSYQTNEISSFTLSFINALKDHKANEIRYKDIVDVISDEFAGNPDQTPLFIIQAGLTEKFCTITKDLRDYLTSFTPLNDLSENDKKISILDIIKEDARSYISKEGAISTLEIIRNAIEGLELSGELQHLFNVRVSFVNSYEDVPKVAAIGRWLVKSPNEYFAQPIWTESYDGDSGEHYSYVSGLQFKIDVTYKVISIDLVSLYPNINSYKSMIVFLLSKKRIRFFHFITNYIESNWDDKELNDSEIKWGSLDSKITDIVDIKAGLMKIRSVIEARIEKDIQEKFNLSSSHDSGADSPAKD